MLSRGLIRDLLKRVEIRGADRYKIDDIVVEVKIGIRREGKKALPLSISGFEISI